MTKSCMEKREKDTLKSVFDAIDIEKYGEIECLEFVEEMKSKFDIPITI